jgi:hypothetical protein
MYQPVVPPQLPPWIPPRRHTWPSHAVWTISPVGWWPLFYSFVLIFYYLVLRPQPINCIAPAFLPMTPPYAPLSFYLLFSSSPPGSGGAWAVPSALLWHFPTDASLWPMAQLAIFQYDILYKLLCARVLLRARYLPQFDIASTYTPPPLTPSLASPSSSAALLPRPSVRSCFVFASVLQYIFSVFVVVSRSSAALLPRSSTPTCVNSHRGASSQAPLPSAALLPRLSASPFVVRFSRLPPP